MPLHILIYILQKIGERLKESLEREIMNKSCFAIFRIIRSKSNNATVELLFA